MGAHRKLPVCDLLERGNHVFVSQYLPDARWSGRNAMRRNSTIIGLSPALIMIESGESRGTHAAGLDALRLGCPLFTVEYEDRRTAPLETGISLTAAPGRFTIVRDMLI